MASYKFILNSAFRRLGVLGANQNATDEEYADVLPVVQSGIYRSLVNSGAFGELTDVTVYDDYIAGNNEHITRKGQYAGQIQLPSLLGEESRVIGDKIYYKGDETLPLDQGTWTDNGTREGVVPPRDCSVVYISDEVSGKTARYIFDGTINKWMCIDEALLDKEAPLSERDLAGFIGWVCYLIADEFGKQPTPVMIQQMNDFKRNITYRFNSPGRITPGQFF